ncbi:MAG: phosphotransferase [Gemmatimonadetes bacterium]|jgi:streptomycin 6-kinase|nr:phosphotransferase [Gemmatimonadota bacterium]MBT6144126.1 phosphotransferase [Gemmatimonadota bacterium]MBT7859867.1 phosphotransferase [Gemmatimonadota bacterium]
MRIPPIPETLIKSTQGYFRGKGAAWLDTLPGLVAEAADRWHLQLGEASPAAGTGYVCFARDGTDRPVVLKIAFPHGEHFTGVEAMRVWGGQGCVRLLDTAEGGTQVLMDWCLPGTNLHELEDEEVEVAHAAALMGRLHRPAPAEHALPPHMSWVEKSLRRMAERPVGEALLPGRLVQALEQTVADLEALRRPVVLHGDLHHENIVQDGDGWIAIDPKGLTGDPALDIGRYCGNQLHRAEAAGGYGPLVDRRIELFASALSEPVDRMRAAAAVDIIMCMGWELEHADFDVESFTENRDRALHLVG